MNVRIDHLLQLFWAFCTFFQSNLAKSVFCLLRNMTVASVRGPALPQMFPLCLGDTRLDSCMSDSLSFVNKSNLCLILFPSSSSFSDNHFGPHWVWRNYHAGIHICTICDGESYVVMDLSHTHSLTHKSTLNHKVREVKKK